MLRTCLLSLFLSMVQVSCNPDECASPDECARKGRSLVQVKSLQKTHVGDVRDVEPAVAKGISKQHSSATSRQRPAVNDVSCNFDTFKYPEYTYLCDWWQDENDDKDWAGNAQVDGWLSESGLAPKKPAEGVRHLNIYCSRCENGQPSCTALLHASPLILSEPKQFQFKYSIVGDYGQLNQLAVIVNGKEVWKAVGQELWQGPDFTKMRWRDGAVALSPPTDGDVTNITFRGVITQKPLGGHVAIDAVKLLPATAPTPPPPEPAPPKENPTTCWCTGHVNQYRCTDGTKAYCTERQDCRKGKKPFHWGKWESCKDKPRKNWWEQ